MSTQTPVLPATPADGDRVNVRVELAFLEPMGLSNTLATSRCARCPLWNECWVARTPGVVSALAGPAVATVSLAGDTLMCDLSLYQPSDREHVIGQVRRLFHLDADPLVVADVLSRDEALSGFVAARPGLRSPGAVDGFEVAVRTVTGQQIPVASSVVPAAGWPGAIVLGAAASIPGARPPPERLRPGDVPAEGGTPADAPPGFPKRRARGTPRG